MQCRVLGIVEDPVLELRRRDIGRGHGGSRGCRFLRRLFRQLDRGAARVDEVEVAAELRLELDRRADVEIVDVSNALELLLQQRRLDGSARQEIEVPGDVLIECGRALLEGWVEVDRCRGRGIENELVLTGALEIDEPTGRRIGERLGRLSHPLRSLDEQPLEPAASCVQVLRTLEAAGLEIRKRRRGVRNRVERDRLETVEAFELRRGLGLGGGWHRRGLESGQRLRRGRRRWRCRPGRAARHLDAGLDEDQVIATGRRPARRLRRAGLDFLDGVHPLPRAARAVAVSAGLEIRRHPLQLLARIVRAGGGAQQLHEHEAEVLVGAVLVGKGLHLPEGFIELPERIHALEILDEVPLRLGDDVFPGVEVRQAEVGLDPARVHPEDLAAERDRVVEKSLFAVQLGGALVGLNRGAGVVQLEVEVADAVVQRKIELGLAAGFEVMDGFLVDIDRLPPVLFLFVLPCRVLELFQIHSARRKSGGKRRCDMGLGKDREPGRGEQGEPVRPPFSRDRDPRSRSPAQGARDPARAGDRPRAGLRAARGSGSADATRRPRGPA